MSSKLEDVIRQYVALPSQPAKTGFYPVRCQVCDDHPWKLRGGFLFDHEGVVYNCFNCKAKAIYDPNTNPMVSKFMVKVLDAFGVPREAWQQIQLEALGKEVSAQPRAQSTELIRFPEPIELPKGFYRVGTRPNDKWSMVAEEYLDLRGVDPKNYPFYLSYDKKWVGRLVIPCYRNGDLIFLQGRDMTNNPHKPKYKSLGSSGNVFYGFDELYRHTDLPLYALEGFFDAYAVGGLGLLGNEITNHQMNHLRRTKRELVFIPDRRGDGHIMAEQALDEGWSISCPEIGDCKDVSEAVRKYGKMYVLKTITENKMTGFMARTYLGFYCEKKNDSTGSKKGQRPS